MNLWRTLVFDQNICLRMIYREKDIQSLKNDAVKSGWVPVIDSCNLGHITTGLLLMNISTLCQTPQPMWVCVIRHPPGQVTWLFKLATPAKPHPVWPVGAPAKPHPVWRDPSENCPFNDMDITLWMRGFLQTSWPGRYGPQCRLAWPCQSVDMPHSRSICPNLSNWLKMAQRHTINIRRPLHSFLWHPYTDCYV